MKSWVLQHWKQRTQHKIKPPPIQSKQIPPIHSNMAQVHKSTHFMDNSGMAQKQFYYPPFTSRAQIDDTESHEWSRHAFGSVQHFTEPVPRNGFRGLSLECQRVGSFFMSWLPKNYSPKNNQNNCNTIFHRHNKIWPEFLLSLNHPTKSATNHTIQTIYNPSIRQLLEDLNCLFQNLMAFNFKKKFDGFDSDGWIKKAEKYFELIGVPNEERVKVAVMYIKGRAGFWWRY